MIYPFERQLFLFFVIWYAIGIVLLSFHLVPPWLEWANVVFLITAGLLSMLYFYRSHTPFKGAGIVTLVFVLSMGMESLGVHTGLFFGDYTYMTDFGPKVAGVPITIGFAWVMVMGTSHVLAAPITRVFRRFAWFIYACYGALIATALDLIIDPVAYKVKLYWVWHEGGAYYDIPFTNFLGWFILSFALHLFIYFFNYGQSAWSNNRSPFWEWRMVLLYGMMALMFIIVAFVNGLTLAPVISALSTGVFYGVYFCLRGKLSQGKLLRDKLS